MKTVLLIIHLFVTLALIGVVLIQRSEGGGLGIGTSQGMGSFMSGRGTANLLTRTTAILATIFMLLSLTLAILNKGGSHGGATSILDTVPATAPAGPAPDASGTAAPGSVVPGTVPAAPSGPQSAAPGASVPGAGTSTAAPGGSPAVPPAPAGPSAPTN